MELVSECIQGVSVPKLQTVAASEGISNPSELQEAAAQGSQQGQMASQFVKSTLAPWPKSKDGLGARGNLSAPSICDQIGWDALLICLRLYLHLQ